MTKHTGYMVITQDEFFEICLSSCFPRHSVNLRKKLAINTFVGWHVIITFNPLGLKGYPSRQSFILRNGRLHTDRGMALDYINRWLKHKKVKLITKVFEN